MCRGGAGRAWEPRGASTHSTSLSMALPSGAPRGHATGGGQPARSAPRRPFGLLLAPLTGLFAAQAVAMATSFAPPGPGSLLPLWVLQRLPGLGGPEALTPRRARRRLPESGNPEVSAAEPQMPFLAALRPVSVGSELNVPASVNQVPLFGVSLLNVMFLASGENFSK